MELNIVLLKKNIVNKIGDYKRRDAKLIVDKKLVTTHHTITLDEAIDLVKQQSSKKCHGCGCEMLFDSYAPWCLYQFSFDKMDKQGIHSKDNLRIICFCCNSLREGAAKYDCIKGCHRGLPRPDGNGTPLDVIMHTVMTDLDDEDP